jgi:hypothetical protein
MLSIAIEKCAPSLPLHATNKTQIAALNSPELGLLQAAI